MQQQQYLKINCRGKQKNSPLDCRSPLGGPSLDTLLNHDFTKAPFVDLRYCRNCRTVFKVTIKALDQIPVVEAVPKDEKIEYKSMEEVFGFVEVHR